MEELFETRERRAANILCINSRSGSTLLSDIEEEEAVTSDKSYSVPVTKDILCGHKSITEHVQKRTVTNEEYGEEHHITNANFSGGLCPFGVFEDKNVEERKEKGYLSLITSRTDPNPKESVPLGCLDSFKTKDSTLFNVQNTCQNKLLSMDTSCRKEIDGTELFAVKDYSNHNNQCIENFTKMEDSLSTHHTVVEPSSVQLRGDLKMSKQNLCQRDVGKSECELSPVNLDNVIDPCNPLSDEREEHKVNAKLNCQVSKHLGSTKTLCRKNDPPVGSQDKHQPTKGKLMSYDAEEMKDCDPYDLFSDEDQIPQKYQPLKRKLSSCQSSVPESNEDIVDFGCDSDYNTLQTHTDMFESKRVKCETENQKTNIEHCKDKVNSSVCYIHSEELMERVNQLIRIEGRANLVYSLIKAYGLLQYISVVPPRSVSESEIAGFHSEDYMKFLKEVSCTNDEELTEIGGQQLDAEGYGLTYDCPVQTGIYETASLIAGASVTAAEALINEDAGIVINWYGGWHHAKRDSASGFCYINDIVLAILKLREKFDKVLYVDIDLHHGDGVEEAFAFTSKVMTVSFHKYATGFFPGSGALESVGLSRGKFYSVNVPLHDGIKDAEFCSIFFSVMRIVKERFSPEALVLQCGADSLAEDPMASFNLSHIGLARCVCFMLAWNIPTLLLGGGGYNFASTAKCWAFLTGLASHRKLPVEIPEHENFLEYGPDYQLTTSVGNRRDCNTKQYLKNLVDKISNNLRNL